MAGVVKGEEIDGKERSTWIRSNAFIYVAFALANVHHVVLKIAHASKRR